MITFRACRDSETTVVFGELAVCLDAPCVPGHPLAADSGSVVDEEASCLICNNVRSQPHEVCTHDVSLDTNCMPFVQT